MSRAVAATRFDVVQQRNLPIMTVSAIMFLLMALGRDAILGDIGWTEPVTVCSVVALVVLTPLTLAAIKSAITPRYSQLAGALILMALALRPFTTMPFRETVFPMVDAMVVFAMGICLLDMRYFIGSLAAFILPWTTIAFLTRSHAQAAGMLVLVLIATIVAYLVIRSRLAFYTRMIELQARVTDLESLLHLCAHCKNMRLENNEWIRIEKYLYDTAKKQVSHGICDDCLEKHYGHLYKDDDVPRTGS